MCPPNTPKRSSESQASKLVAISFLAFRLPTRCGTRCDYILYFADHQNLRSIVNNYRKVRIPLIRWPEPSFVTVPYLTFDYYLITAPRTLQVSMSLFGDDCRLPVPLSKAVFLRRLVQNNIGVGSWQAFFHDFLKRNDQALTFALISLITREIYFLHWDHANPF